MKSTLFTELSNSEATSLVGGQRTARAFGTFSARATGIDTAETDGDATTEVTVTDDEVTASSTGFSSSSASEE
jgi:hypothetical protein